MFKHRNIGRDESNQRPTGAAYPSLLCVNFWIQNYKYKKNLKEMTNIKKMANIKREKGKYKKSKYQVPTGAAYQADRRRSRRDSTEL